MHTQIVQIFDVYEYQKTVYIVMEHHADNGGPIWWKNSAHKRYREPTAAQIVWQILHIVKYMHDHQIVHGECKSNESKMTRTGHPCIRTWLEHGTLSRIKLFFASLSVSLSLFLSDTLTHQPIFPSDPSPSGATDRNDSTTRNHGL